MSLSSIGLLASSSLSAITAQMNVVSRNIANAGVPGASRKIADVVTGYDGAPFIADVRRASNNAMFKTNLQAIAGEAKSQAISGGLDKIALVMNSASDASADASPANAIAELRNSLQNYDAEPSSAIAANNVLLAAKKTVSTLGAASQTVQDARRDADSAMAASVAKVNELLAKFERVNKDIVTGSQANWDVTDLEDQRDQLLASLSEEMGVTTVTGEYKDTKIYTDSGVTLFDRAPRTVTFQRSPDLSLTSGGNAVVVDGVTVAGGPKTPLSVQSGNIAGQAELRDVLAPKAQAQLDEIARGLVVAFGETDQTGSGAPALPGLFTYEGASGIPGASIIPGLASALRVNANVDPDQGGVLERLRDGGISDPGNPAYVYNASGGSGFSGRIEGMIAALGVNQSFDPQSGLNASASALSFSAAAEGWVASQRQTAKDTASYQGALASQTSQALSNETGVNADEEMSKMLALQNSYEATAKIITTMQAMYDALFAAVR